MTTGCGTCVELLISTEGGHTMRGMSPFERPFLLLLAVLEDFSVCTVANTKLAIFIWNLG